MPTPNLAPLMMIPLFGWIVYRRVRRQFGRQLFAPKPQIARLVLLVVVMAAMVVMACVQPGFALPIGVGLFGGALIGVVNLKLTRFEWTPGGDYYYPHPYVGAALSLLLIARLLYRFAALGGMPGLGSQPPPGAGQSPLTFGLLALLIGYYVAYSAGLLIVYRLHHQGKS